VPARLARDVAAGVAGLAGAGFYLAWNINLRQSFSPRHPDLSNFSSLVGKVEWLPSAWPGHALSAVIAGHTAEAATWVAFSVAFGVLVLVMAEVLYRRTLLTGLGVFGGPPPIWRRGAAKQAIAVARAGAASPFRAIALKDWLSYRRDIRRLSRMLPALLFPVGYAFAFLRPSQSLASFWTQVFLVGFISMFMSTALATPSIPSERRGFQLLRMAPMTMAQVIRAKIMLTLPPVLVLTLAFSMVVATVSRSGIAQYAELALLVLWLGTGFVAVGVSAGAIDPRFDASDDRRAVGLVGTLTGLGGTLGFGLLSVGSLALLVFGYAAAQGIRELGPVPATPAVGALMWAGALVLLVGAAGIVVALLWFANSRLRSWEGAIASV
jgi:hypothetical protein